MPKISRAAIFALIISLIVVVSQNYVVVSSSISETVFPKTSPYFIDLSNSSTGLYADGNQVAQYVDQHAYVSNYLVDVLVDQSPGAEVGGQFLFHMVIEDHGINSLSNDKYFYIAAFNPLGNLAALFPTPGQGISVYSTPPPFTSVPSVKWADWAQATTNITPDGRTALFNGTMGNSKIWYRLAIPDHSSSIGTWNIYIIVFDKVYLDRWGKPLACQTLQNNQQVCPPDLNNEVTYSLIQFNVVPMAPATSQSLTYIPWVFEFLIPFAIGYFGYRRDAKAIEKALFKVGRKIGEHWLFILIIIVVLVAYYLGTIGTL